MKKQTLVLMISFFLSAFAFAAPKKCSDFSKEAVLIEENASQKQGQLNQVDHLIDANNRAVKELGKKCSENKNPNCNPMIFNMIAQQTMNLSGQRQKLSDEIMNAQMKHETALHNYKSCKQLVQGKLFE